MNFQSSYSIEFRDGAIRYGGMALPIPSARRLLASVRTDPEPYAKRLAGELEKAFRDGGISEHEETERSAA